jgi:hypothetical protein
MDENKNPVVATLHREKSMRPYLSVIYTLAVIHICKNLHGGRVGLQLLLDGAPQLLGGSVQVAGAHHAVQAVVGGRLGGAAAGIALDATSAGSRAGATGRGEFGPRDSHQLDIIHPGFHSETKRKKS